MGNYCLILDCNIINLTIYKDKLLWKVIVELSVDYNLILKIQIANNCKID